MDHEAAFVRAFMHKEKWARYLRLLPDRRRRGEVLARLDAKWDHLPQYATEVPEDQDYPEALEQLLLALGAPPTCHLVIDDRRLDGRELPLAEALQAVCLHLGGSLLSCLPGRLAFYRPEAGRGVILQKGEPEATLS